MPQCLQFNYLFDWLMNNIPSWKLENHNTEYIQEANIYSKPIHFTIFAYLVPYRKPWVDYTRTQFG